jgi:hypothetical protein
MPTPGLFSIVGMAAVPSYRLYTVKSDGHITGVPEVVDSPDDEAALQQAKKRLNGRALEVWNAVRCVGWIEPCEGTEKPRL